MGRTECELCSLMVNYYAEMRDFKTKKIMKLCEACTKHKQVRNRAKKERELELEE